MKLKVNNLLSRIPRPVRACVCLVLAVTLLLSYYVMLGCPVLGMRQHFRRAERVHMVGRSKIVDVLSEAEYGEFMKLYVAESEHGISFFGQYASSHPYDYTDEKEYYYQYLEKGEDITLTAAPNVWGTFWGSNDWAQTLPVYLFTENNQAVRASVVFTIRGELGSRGFPKDIVHIADTTDRTETGYFRFTLYADKAAELDALEHLSCTTGGSSTFGISTSSQLNEITVIIRLYDAAGEMISEENRTIFERP
jgi:hypothetical protein